jgi:hypothetical protein
MECKYLNFPTYKLQHKLNDSISIFIGFNKNSEILVILVGTEMLFISKNSGKFQIKFKFGKKINWEKL